MLLPRLRYPATMKTKWAWFFGIATLGALVIGVLALFTLPGFHWLSFLLGVAAGATIAGMIASLGIKDETPIRQAKKSSVPKATPARVSTASFASPSTPKRHGARLKSYQIMPAGRRFVWVNSGGTAGTIKPDGERFVVYDANANEIGRVANEAEAVEAILQDADQ
jgi:hypothetical protein